MPKGRLYSRRICKARHVRGLGCCSRESVRTLCAAQDSSKGSWSILHRVKVLLFLYDEPSSHFSPGVVIVEGEANYRKDDGFVNNPHRTGEGFPSCYISVGLFTLHSLGNRRANISTRLQYL